MIVLKITEDRMTLPQVAQDTSWLAGLGSDLLSGLVSGIATAAVLYFVSLGYLRRRRNTLITEINKTFAITGQGHDISGDAHLTLRNDTDIDVTIRNVSLNYIAGPNHPDGLAPGTACGTFRLNYQGPSEFGADEKNHSEKDSRGFVRLPAFTEARWGIDVESLKQMSKGQRFSGATVTYHFFDLGNRPVVRACTAGNPAHTASWFNAALDGQFDSPRRQPHRWQPGGVFAEVKDNSGGGVFGQSSQASTPK